MLLVVRWGIVAVAIAAAVVHSLFSVVAYALMLRETAEHPLRRLWDDVAPATVSCVGLAAVALPASMAFTALHLPAVLWLAALGLVAVPPYLITLRVCFPATWRSQRGALERILPWSKRLGRMKRPPVATGASSSA